MFSFISVFSGVTTKCYCDAAFGETRGHGAVLQESHGRSGTLAYYQKQGQVRVFFCARFFRPAIRGKHLYFQTPPNTLCGYVVANVISLVTVGKLLSSSSRWVMPMMRDITRYLIFEFPNEGDDSCDILTNVVKSIEEIVPRTSVSQEKSNFFIGFSN